MSDSIIRDLKALIAFSDGVIEQEPCFVEGYRYGSGNALCVVMPETIEELSAVVRYCFAHNLKLVPQGANSGLVGAALPDISGTQIVLSMKRYRGIENMDADDRSMTVKAGTLLSEVNARAGEHDLFFPIDLGADPSIGGMVATNTGGAKLLRYGDVRRNLLGLEIMLADQNATVISDLSGLRKDNSGIDWKQLFIGSGGAFGIITRAKLELQPRPFKRTSALLVAHDFQKLQLIIFRLEHHFADMLSACEGISQNALRLTLQHHPHIQNPFGPELPEYALLVELAISANAMGNVDLDHILAEGLGPMLEGDAPLLADALIGRGDDFWTIRHAISDGLRREGEVLGFDISVARSRYTEFREQAIALVNRVCPKALVCDFGHCGDGGIHFNLVFPRGEMHEHDVTGLRNKIYELVVQSFGGSFSAEHGLGPQNFEYYDRYTNENERKVAQHLKSFFDPLDIMGNVRL
jgi:FAD/FMN-containing dehydrogenase